MKYELPSDNLLVTTLRAIGDGVISCDRSGAVVLMDAVAEELTGWTEAEVRGINLKNVFVIVNETTCAVVEDLVGNVYAVLADRDILEEIRAQAAQRVFY